MEKRKHVQLSWMNSFFFQKGRLGWKICTKKQNKKKNRWCRKDGDGWLDTLRMRFLNRAYYPAAAQIWSSIQKSLSEPAVVNSALLLPRPCRGLLVCWSQVEGRMRREMMVLEEMWESSLLLSLPIASSVTAVQLGVVCCSILNFQIVYNLFLSQQSIIFTFFISTPAL